jgi:hypothetical protein
VSGMNIKALGLAMGSNKPEKWGGKPPTACCTRCESALVSTMAFPHFEFVCVVCGHKLGFVDPLPKRWDEPGLQEQMEKHEAQWKERPDDVNPQDWLEQLIERNRDDEEPVRRSPQPLP